MKSAAGQEVGSWLQGGQVSAGTSNAIKGILIIAICVGHNRVLTGSVDGLFASLYFWHVQGFFFLAFITRGLNVADRKVSDVVVRYLTPFLVFAAAGLLANLVWRAPENLFLDLGMLLWSGAAVWSERVTGMQLFWFLPTFCSFAIAQIMASRIRRARPYGANQAVIAASVLFAFAILIPTGIQKYLPWGLGLVAYLFAVSIFFAATLEAYRRSGPVVRKVVLAVCVAAVLLTCLVVLPAYQVNIAKFRYGNGGIFSAGGFLDAAIASSGTIGANILVVVIAARLAGSRILNLIGQHSLQIFLLHSFVQYPAWLLLKKYLGELPDLAVILIGISLTLIAMGVSLAIAVGLAYFPRLRELVFPRNLGTLRSALKSVREK